MKKNNKKPIFNIGFYFAYFFGFTEFIIHPMILKMINITRLTNTIVEPAGVDIK